MFLCVDTRAAEAGDIPPVDTAVPGLRFPLMCIGPAPDPAAAAAALSRLGGFDWAIPVSPSAVRASLSLLDGRWPTSCGIALLGQGSRHALDAGLLRCGQDPQALRLLQAPPQQQDSEGLWSVLQQLRPQGWQGQRVMLLRGQSGREWLAQRLQEAGAEVERVAVYSRRAPTADAPTLQRLRMLLQEPRRWQLGAVEAVDNLAVLLAAAGVDAAAALASQIALVRHPRVADAAARLGFGQVRIAH